MKTLERNQLKKVHGGRINDQGSGVCVQCHALGKFGELTSCWFTQGSDPCPRVYPNSTLVWGYAVPCSPGCIMN